MKSFISLGECSGLVGLCFKSWRAVTVITLAGLISPPSFAQNHLPDEWQIGQEYEFRPGYYSKLVAEEDGWKTIITEFKDGSLCSTVKAADESYVVEPINGRFLSLDPVFVEITGDGVFEPGWRVKGPHRGEYEYRTVGDRFMTEGADYNKDLSVSETTIEYIYTGWKYPEIRVDMERRSGTADMTGLRSAYERHLSHCEK
ncbi:hypothetical protein [Ponticaulis profundi]|uniref:Uncharacterized protein n=1 Tax=Ponticaulis profundi TaxID=2665222 RepID=A0ABW1S854_9PROT